MTSNVVERANEIVSQISAVNELDETELSNNVQIYLLYIIAKSALVKEAITLKDELKKRPASEPGVLEAIVKLNKVA